MDRNLLVNKTPSFIDVSKLLRLKYKSLRFAMFLPNYQSEYKLDYSSYSLLLSAFEFDFKSEYDIALEIFEYLHMKIDEETYNSIERINIIKSTDPGLISVLRGAHVEDSFVKVANTKFNNFVLPDGIITHCKINPLE